MITCYLVDWYSFTMQLCYDYVIITRYHQFLVSSGLLSKLCVRLTLWFTGLKFKIMNSEFYVNDFEINNTKDDENNIVTTIKLILKDVLLSSESSVWASAIVEATIAQILFFFFNIGKLTWMCKKADVYHYTQQIWALIPVLVTFCPVLILTSILLMRFSASVKPGRWFCARQKKEYTD